MGKLITINRYIDELTIEIHPLWGPQWALEDPKASQVQKYRQQLETPRQNS